MKARRAPLVTVVAALLALLWASPAAADIAPLSAPTWKNNTTLGTTTRPYVWFTTSVPVGDRRSRIRDGFTQWNNVGEPLQYSFAGSDYGNYDPMTSCGPTSNSVFLHWTRIDGGGGVLGQANYCYRTYNGISARTTAWIQFDSAEEWCTGTGDCFDGVFGAGANMDLWSVATHESGHVSALGHFNGSSSICGDNADQATMCPSYKPGTERMRSLSSSDVASLRYYY
ncbi:MAG TPA: matrixin family metalloprotease [Mycobacteriales bacterium]|jgi:hypothetical protein